MSNQPPPYTEKGNAMQPPYPTGDPMQPPYPVGVAYPGPNPAGHNQGEPYNPGFPTYQTTNVVLNQPYPPGATVVQPQYQAGGTTTVIYQTNVHFTSIPENMTCPNCQCQIVTSIGYETGGLTWLLCFIIFLFVGILGCCLIPFCVNDCKDVHHYCPNCKRKLGVFRRM